MLDKKKKEQIIKKFQTHAGDTGSSEVQIAILSAEIDDLTEHLKEHKKDFSSRRGLIRKVIQRRRLLRYLEKEDNESFTKLVKKLKLKITPMATLEQSLEEDEELDTKEQENEGDKGEENKSK